MNEQLKEMYDNAQKVRACEEELKWLSQFETFEEAEKDEQAPTYFLWYAKNIIKGRFELGEKAISRNSHFSYDYARTVLKGRFELGEKAISKSAYCSFLYAMHALKTRFELGEDAISKDVWNSYKYASDVIKGRFELGEEAISKNPYYKERYKKFLDEISTFDQNWV